MHWFNYIYRQADLMSRESSDYVSGTHPAVSAIGHPLAQHTRPVFARMRKLIPGACGSGKAAGTHRDSFAKSCHFAPGVCGSPRHVGTHLRRVCRSHRVGGACGDVRPADAHPAQSSKAVTSSQESPGTLNRYAHRVLGAGDASLSCGTWTRDVVGARASISVCGASACGARFCCAMRAGECLI